MGQVKQAKFNLAGAVIELVNPEQERRKP